MGPKHALLVIFRFQPLAKSLAPVLRCGERRWGRWDRCLRAEGELGGRRDGNTTRISVYGVTPLGKFTVVNSGMKGWKMKHFGTSKNSSEMNLPTFRWEV